MDSKSPNKKRQDVYPLHFISNEPGRDTHSVSLEFVIYFNTEGLVTGYNEQLAGLPEITKTSLLNFNLIRDVLPDAFSDSVKMVLQGKESCFKGPLTLNHLFLESVHCRFYPVKDETFRVLSGIVVLEPVDLPGPEKVSTIGSELLQIIADNSHDVISLFDFSGKLIYASPSLFQLTGYTPEELLNLDHAKILSPQDWDLFSEAFKDVQQSENPVVVEHRIVHKNGDPIWIESSYQKSAKSDFNYLILISRNISKRKFFEEALKNSESRYRNLVLNLTTGVALLDIHGNVLEVNRALHEIMGERIAGMESPGFNYEMLELESAAMDGVAGNFEKCINEKVTVHGVSEIMDRSGKERHFTYNFIPLCDEEGQLVNVITNINEVTHQVLAEKESKQRAEFLDLVINSIQQPLFVKDEQHRWVILNNAALEMMGHSLEDLLGKSDYDMFPKEQADVFWSYDNRVFEEGTTINEEKITWSNGDIRTVITAKYLYKEKLSGKRFIVGTIHDISDIKKAEQELRESELKFRELFDNANDFILTTDLHGNITNANKAVLGGLKVSFDKIQKFNIFDFCTAEILEEAKRHFYGITSNSENVPFEFDIKNTNISIEIRGKLIYKDGIATGVQAIGRDITERRQVSLKLREYSERLQALNASKDKFFSIIAHDLKSPFNGLLGFSELLLEELDEMPKEKLRQYVSIIRNTARNSYNLLENLLKWSRLQTGRMPFVPEKLSPYLEANLVIDLLSSIAFKKQISIVNEISKKNHVFADPQMLQSMLENLISNAIKYSYPQGTISVFSVLPETSLKSEENAEKKFLTIAVSDTGVGIPDADKEKLFDIGVNHTTLGTANERGTGLGLKIVREMAERCGGKIWLESSGAGHTIFKISLPAV